MGFMWLGLWLGLVVVGAEEEDNIQKVEHILDISIHSKEQVERCVSLLSMNILLRAKEVDISKSNFLNLLCIP